MQFTNSATSAAAHSLIDDIEVCFILNLLAIAELEMTTWNKLTRDYLQTQKRSMISRKYYFKVKKHGVIDRDPIWEEMMFNTSNALFKRKFWMTKVQFKELCSRILLSIENTDFKPEISCPKHIICGELPLGIALWLFVGGSYLDQIGALSNTNISSFGTIYKIFHSVMEWLDKTFEFELISTLKNLEVE